MYVCIAHVMMSSLLCMDYILHVAICIIRIVLSSGFIETSQVPSERQRHYSGDEDGIF